MKKNIIWLSLGFCFLALAVTSVFAQQAGTASGKPRQSAIDRSLQFKKKVATKSSEMREAMEERKQKFQENLQSFKNEMKKKAVERLYQRMVNVNKKAAERLLKKLERLEMILAKIESRAQKKEEKGADVAVVYSGIEAVEGKIAVLKGKIQEQADKVYDFDISDEENLRLQAQPAVGLQQSDLKALRDELINIRKEMVDLVQMLASIQVSARPATGSAGIME